MHLRKRVSLNLNVRELSESATLAINQRSNDLKADGCVVYRLGLGQSPFPVPAPVVEALQFHAHEKDYLPPRGLRQLREAVADFQRRNHGADADAANVIIGPGSKELMFLLQLVFYGELLLPTPCWVSYAPQALIIGRKISMIPTSYDSRWHITADQLERHLDSEQDSYRPRILVLNYPGNPDGCTLSSGELQQLAEVARKYEVILLSDEIYGQLNHDGAHISVARYYPEGTIVSSGLSKWCGAGGWRLGTFTFPRDLDWLREKMVAVASETYTSVCAPIQFAAVRAFKGGVDIERYLWHVRRILKTLGNECASILCGSGLRVHPPAGAFYLFLDFSPFAEPLRERGITTSDTLCERLLIETGVAILPGSSFGRPPGELTARMAYVDFDGARALTAAEMIPLDEDLPPDFTKLWCRNVTKACELMVEWVRQKGQS